MINRIKTTDMDEKLYALEMAGQCNELTAWRILKDVSADMLVANATQVSPSLIEIKEDGSFALASSSGTEMKGFEAPETLQGTTAPNSGVWSLAASLFYIVMGCQVMNGKGGSAQHESSRLPFMRSTWPKLSELIQHCLHYQPEKRPSLQEVNTMATEQFQACLEAIKKGPRFQAHSETQGRPDSEAIATYWPEPMQSVNNKNE